MKKKKTSAAYARQLEEELKKAKDELDAQTWGLKKTNEAIKLLYKELEAKNRKLEELDRLKSDFVSTVSHELRTPLSITKEGVSLMLDGITGEINEKQRNILIISRDNIDRLARMIDNVLDISKIESGRIKLKKEPLDLSGLIRSVASSFEAKMREKKLDMKVILPDVRIEIRADKDRITQVFTNLIYNAIKFTEEGFIEISAVDKEEEVECSVADSGRGISKDDLQNVFGKFQQFGRVPGSGEKGTGLGLSITKGIVDIHGGRIWAESKLGEGTKFVFTLPK